MKNGYKEIKYMLFQLFSTGMNHRIFSPSSTDEHTRKLTNPQRNKEIAARSGPLWGRATENHLQITTPLSPSCEQASHNQRQAASNTSRHTDLG